jgi:tRNA threonylcarbamoyladenosine biosynthesis protein TsaB
MILLAVDTVSRSCSVALVDRQGPISQSALVSRETHSRHLMGLVSAILTASGVDLESVGGFGVTVGPGSFTGLRIGISAVKGLAAATGRPVVGISSLAALAEPFRWLDGLVCPMMDARRNEVYAGLYRAENGVLVPVMTERAVLPETLLADINGDCMFVGDGAVAYRELISQKIGGRARFAAPYCSQVQAGVVGYLALRKFERGETMPGRDLVPAYLRRSDAERSLSSGKN